MFLIIEMCLRYYATLLFLHFDSLTFVVESFIFDLHNNLSSFEANV